MLHCVLHNDESPTPLLGRVRSEATWENVREHAAGAFSDWGSRGRRFESDRPDRHERPLRRASMPSSVAFLVTGEDRA